jgi:hypothetical protein
MCYSTGRLTQGIIPLVNLRATFCRYYCSIASCRLLRAKTLLSSVRAMLTHLFQPKARLLIRRQLRMSAGSRTTKNNPKSTTFADTDGSLLLSKSLQPKNKIHQPCRTCTYRPTQHVAMVEKWYSVLQLKSTS